MLTVLLAGGLPSEHFFSLNSVYVFSFAYCRFFSNRGAVAGVFLLVGLAITSLFIWLAFWYRRRRRLQLLQRDADAAIGYESGRSPRAPIHDDDDLSHSTPSSDMRQHPGPDTLVYGNRAADYLNIPLDSPGSDPFASNPFFGGQNAPDNHALTNRPSPTSPDTTASLLAAAGLGGSAAIGAAALAGGNSTDVHGSGTSSSGHGHGQQRPQHDRWNSSASSEPLIAGASGLKPGGFGDSPPTPPPRSPLRQRHYVAVNQDPSQTSLHGVDDVSRPDDRLDPHLTARLRRSDTDMQSMRDNVDYSRPVLAVCKKECLTTSGTV